MGLVTKITKVKWGTRNIEHYISKGYTYEKGDIGKEFEVNIEDLSKGSHIKVEVECDKCGKKLSVQWYDYKKYVNEKGEYYCHKCAHSKDVSFEQWLCENLSLEEANGILSRWDYEKNIDKKGKAIKPSEIGYASSGFNKKGYWFKCPCGKHESELKRINNYIRKNGSISCIKCNSIMQYLTDNNMEGYYDYEKNLKINPWEIASLSSKKIWVRCIKTNYHESHLTTCANFINNNGGCPYCTTRNGKVHSLDSLGKHIIDIYDEEFLKSIWSDKNKKSVFECTPQSSKKVWWKCPDGKHEDYYRNIHTSNVCQFRCPQCSAEQRESSLEIKTKEYLSELGYGYKTQENTNIQCYNQKTGYLLPYDIEFQLSDGKMCVIECNGIQHYKNIDFFEEDIKYRQYKDKIKKDYALEQGYSFIELPYTLFDKNDKYKKVIDYWINKFN